MSIKINFLIMFLGLLDKYDIDFYSCECCNALSFEHNNEFFIEELCNKEDLRKEINKFMKKLDKIKIKELPKGMIIWNYKNEILGITGMNLDEKYYECNCIKIEGNRLDYLLIGDENENSI